MSSESTSSGENERTAKKHKQNVQKNKDRDLFNKPYDRTKVHMQC